MLIINSHESSARISAYLTAIEASGTVVSMR